MKHGFAGTGNAALVAILSLASLSSFAAPALKDVIDLHESSSNALSTSGSYLYSWRLAIKDDKGERLSSSKTLYRRNGNRYFQANDFNGYTNPSSETKERPDSTFFVVAFDGEITRSNNVEPAFLRYYQPDGPLLQKVDQFDTYFERDRKAPEEMDERPAEVKRRPDGTIADGHGHTDPGMVAGDLFLEAVTYEIGLVINNKTTWADLMRNGMAEVSSASNGVVRVTGHRLEPELRKDWPSRYELDIDVDKGGAIVGARIFNPDNTVWAGLYNVELKQDKSTGFWYPARYVEEINAKDGQRRYEFEMVDANFEPVPDETFQDVWFDEQHVLDLRNNRTYFYLRRDPTHYKEDLYDDPLVLSDEDRLKRISGLLVKDFEALTPADGSQDVPAHVTPAAPPSVEKAVTERSPRLIRIVAVLAGLGVLAVGARAFLRRRPMRAANQENGGGNG